MIKRIKIFLIIISSVLTSFLIFNIYNNKTLIKENSKLKKEIKTSNEEIITITDNGNSLNEEIVTLEENNKEKLKLYNKWINQEKEINQKISN